LLEQLNQDLLDPLIDIVFDFMDRQGLIPEPPQELQGIKLKVEYVSAMAQAQKLGHRRIERFGGFVTRLIEVNLNPLTRWTSIRRWMSYGDMTSVPQGMIRSDDDVAEIRAQRAKQQQAAQAAESMKSMAGSAKDFRRRT